MRDNRPEVMVKFGKAISLEDAAVNRKDYTHYLAHSLESVCDELAEDISQGRVEDYKILFKQHLKWYRRIEQRLKRIDLPPVSGV